MANYVQCAEEFVRRANGAVLCAQSRLDWHFNTCERNCGVVALRDIPWVESLWPNLMTDLAVPSAPLRLWAAVCPHPILKVFMTDALGMIARGA
jgi:hypothetical protein